MLGWPIKTTCALILGATVISSPALAEGDATAGQAKAATCVACHGADGNSLTGEWPNLAGQHPAYLARQTLLYRIGARQDPVMQGMVLGLSEQDIDDISAFYATKKVAPGYADESMTEVGGALYRGGDLERGIPACMGCHGPAGGGNPGPSYPAVAGQKAEYSAKTLRDFRDGAVWGEGDDANVVMSEVAADLTDSEIAALASYMQGLYATGPAAATAE